MKSETNSYFAAKREWDERYGSLISQVRQWRHTATFAIATALLAVGGLIWQTRQSRVIPFVIALDQDRPVALGRAHQVSDGGQHVMRTTLFEWVTELRAVTSDQVAQRRIIDRVYAHIAQNSQASKVISDWYRTTPPFGRTETVAVDVKAVLPLSDRTYQLEWIETTYDGYGAVKLKERYRGSFDTARQPPTDEALIMKNPFGIYVTNANWAKVL